MKMTRQLATVFGGSGFLGRYVVGQLAQQGYTVRVAVRNVAGANFLKMMGDVGQIVPLYAPTGEDAAVARAVADAKVVINLTGILAERRRGDFFRIHAEGARRIAQRAAGGGVQSMIHVSAIADAASGSDYARSKAEGEAAVRDAFPTATILRPSVVFGAEDQFFNRFARMAVLSRVIPIVGGATRMQPVYVGDVAEAVVAAITASPGVYELGGPARKTFRELIVLMLHVIERRRLIWDLPLPLARFQARFLEHLPGKLLTRDQIKLLACDNVVAPGAADLASLGVIATPLDLVIPGYLARYRPGGRRREAAFSK